MLRSLAITGLVILLDTMSGVCCAQWVQCGGARNGGYVNTNVPVLASIGTHIFAGINVSGVYRSDDSGVTWVAANNGLNGTYINGFTSIDTTLFAMLGIELLSTSNLGENWDSLGDDNVFWPITAIGSSLIGSNNGFFLSTDQGISWTQRGNGFDWGELVCLMSQGSNLYAGNSFGDCGTVYWSTDSGSTWTDLDLGVGCTDVYSLASDSNFIFSGTGPGFNEGGSGIFRRAANDTSWTAINNGLPDMISTAIESIVASSNNIFFGTNGLGVFYSSDYGDTWDSINEGLTSLEIEQLLIVPPFIYAGSAGSAWRRPLSDFGISSVAQTTPLPPQIQSYPNPFTQSTTITFSSQDEGYVEITIVNLLGAQVTRIFSGELTAGDHSFTWDANGMAPGMYECIVQMNGNIQQLPVMLSK